MCACDGVTPDGLAFCSDDFSGGRIAVTHATRRHGCVVAVPVHRDRVRRMGQPRKWPRYCGVRLIAYYADASESSGFNSIQLEVMGSPSTYATGQDIDARLSLYSCASNVSRRCLTFELAQNTLFSQVDVTDYLPTEMMISFSGRSTYVDAEISRIAVTRLC